MLVSGVIVDNGVDLLAPRDLGVDGTEKADELLMAMTLHVAADNSAIEDVEGGEQGRRAMSFIVMGHGAGAARLHRQSRLGAIERLNLALLIDARTTAWAGGSM